MKEATIYRQALLAARDQINAMLTYTPSFDATDGEEQAAILATLDQATDSLSLAREQVKRGTWKVPSA